MSLTNAQQAAATSPQSIIVTAGAGTGKTYMLVERYLYYLVEKGLSPLEIVAVTFTEKAAQELRSRIRSQVRQQLPNRPDILAELEAAPISTIHALASRICREHPQAANVAADFQVLEDLEGKIWLYEGLETALSKLPIQVFETIPYSLLSRILATLLDDPLMAERSLNQQIDWSELAQKLRDRALEDLVNHPQWRELKDILTSNIGKPEDKLEAIRQGTVSAILSLENGDNISENLQVLYKIDIRYGSKKNWGENIQTVKDALKALREELVKPSLNENLINAEVGEADHKLAEMLAALKEAYREVKDHLQKLKWQGRVLTFADLEIGALTALQNNPTIQLYYQQRWRSFLVDEFQDTNPIQGEILELLTQTGDLTIVGDKKQSIYGFRRADIGVFNKFRKRIIDNQGDEIILNQSFRTHQKLINQINQVFSPLLGDLRQDLEAVRIDPPSPRETLQVFVIPKTAETDINQRRIAEGNLIAKTLKEMLDNQIPVFDKQTQQLRPIQPGDIAILTRTWEPLDSYGEALAAAQIPLAPSGGGNLLETQEAKDAWSLLKFLADPGDDIALVALLRSPFFAISDRLLFTISRQSQLSHKSTSENISWWQILTSASPAEFKKAIDTLKTLLKQRQIEPPSRLLQIADQLTGYTAIIANLPASNRRLADFSGFRELVQILEQGTDDLFGVVRRLKRLKDKAVTVERPPINTSNAVSLMTIFAAKGLEWPMVVVADLSRPSPNSSVPVYFDPEYGVAIRCKDDDKDLKDPVLYNWLKYRSQQREEAEALRILYVALTRSRDYILLTAPQEKGNYLDKLYLGLQAANIPITTLEINSDDIIPPVPPSPPPPAINPPLLTNAMTSGLFELPVTSLSEYKRCPTRFQFMYILGHPGLSEEANQGMIIGQLVHNALEYDIRDIDQLRKFANNGSNEQSLREAIYLAQEFDNTEEFKRFIDPKNQREVELKLDILGVTFNGVADLIGDNWVLDYKTDKVMRPEHHNLQLWAYAKALNCSEAHIAYLRHKKCYSFSPEILAKTAHEAESIVRDIVEGYYPPKPSRENCQTCRYGEICEHRYESI
ncbi:UvrD-helicase domain-containing protein [Limnospira fusiformis]|uniref:UvrD-helicase domain-containing protein n=1 Tax=Limnospira fusiformis TaxID=54297 RepID=UPI0034E0C0FB